MKLNDFDSKSNKPKGDYSVIIGDTYEKSQLKNEIDQLSEYKYNYSKIEKENERLRNDVSFLKDRISTYEQALLNFTSDNAENIRKIGERAGLYEQVNNLKDSLKLKSNEFHTLETTHKETVKELDTLSKLFVKIEAENSVYKETQSSYTTDKIKLVREKDSIFNDLSSLKEKFNLISNQAIEKDKTIISLTKDNNYLSSALTESKDREELAVKQETLAKDETVRHLEAFQKIKKASNQVNATIQHLTEENKTKTTELEKLEKQYNTIRVDAGLMHVEIQRLRQEAEKPRYASVSSIERMEGFRFPRNFEPRKNSLGNAKPTLLKVRK